MDMEMIVLVLDLLIPSALIFFGRRLKHNPPQDPQGSSGYRSRRARQSQEAWDFAQQQVGKIWDVAGMCLMGLVLFSKIVVVLQVEHFSLICAALGCLCFVLPIPVVESRLKQRFGD